MKNRILNRFTLCFITMLLIMFPVELIFRLISELEIFDLNVIRILFGDIIFSAIFAFFISLPKYRVGKIFGFIISLFVSI